MLRTIKVIDLFAGSGGLGEGFSSFCVDGFNPFRIAISVEKDKYAYATLRLRAFARLLNRNGCSLAGLYAYYRGLSSVPWTPQTYSLWRLAGEEARQIELGKDETTNGTLYKRIASRLDGDDYWVLIGGPPCQAYSLVGRARTGEKNRSDPRHFLYKEYLKIVRKFKPAMFVMENVGGLLSCKLENRHIVHDILNGLAGTDATCPKNRYSINSIVDSDVFLPGNDPSQINLGKFVVKSENYGIPQARHRVILVGIREDVNYKLLPKLTPSPVVTVREALEELPALRSGLSRGKDSLEHWKNSVLNEFASLMRDAGEGGYRELTAVLENSAKKIKARALERGGRYIRRENVSAFISRSMFHDWVRDENPCAWLNHETRSHMQSDLRRYAYVSAYALAYGKNPNGMRDFDLEGLAPNHANWKSGTFMDRFRAQLGNLPSSTITSHISKDGHAYIHPDPSQCRSLTVREAARLQTFPDNYFFDGPRTSQFVQVGNAVPPLLARQIAACVWKVLDDHIMCENGELLQAAW